MTKESHNIEFKILYKDDYLKTICAFANSDGGSLFIGIDDNGTIEFKSNNKSGGYYAK